MSLLAIPGFQVALPHAAWLDSLLPASFRGVPFKVSDHTLAGGRRLVTHEFPFRDIAYIESLGRKVRAYTIRGYVIGPDYFPDRDALLAALEQDAPGTLVHPWLGTLQVEAGTFRLTENQQEGGIAYFEMQLLEAGALPSPLVAVDTSSALLRGSTDLLGALAAGFQAAFALLAVPEFVIASAQATLGAFADAAAALLATPGLVLADAESALSGFEGEVGGIITDAAGIAAGVTGFFDAFAGAVTDILATSPVPPAPFDLLAIAGSALTTPWAPGSADALLSGSASKADYVITSRGERPPSFGPADPAWGALGLSGFGAGLTDPGNATANRAIEKANQAAIVALVQGGAVAAAAQIYSATTFPYSQDAIAARDALLALIDVQTLAASAAGQDVMVTAFTSLSLAVARDLTQRAARLPALGAYRTGAPTSSLVLAHRLYRDASRADELVGLNNAPHPAFLPLTGSALAS